jgi:hypothetical protein
VGFHDGFRCVCSEEFSEAVLMASVFYSSAPLPIWGPLIRVLSRQFFIFGGFNSRGRFYSFAVAASFPSTTVADDYRCGAFGAHRDGTGSHDDIGATDRLAKTPPRPLFFSSPRPTLPHLPHLPHLPPSSSMSAGPFPAKSRPVGIPAHLTPSGLAHLHPDLGGWIGRLIPSPAQFSA